MKRVLFILGLLGLLVAASACGGGDKQEVTVPGDNGNVKVTTGGDLPSDFPDDFPIFKDANVIASVRGEQEGQSGYFVTWETDASADDVTAFYKEELNKDPWETSGTFESAQGSVIGFARTDGKDLGGGITVSSDGNTQFVVFMGEGIGSTPSDQSEEEAAPTPEEAEATPETAAPSGEAELPDEVNLPNDYPTDVAPIPDGARVTDASSFTSGGQTTFAITYLTEDDPNSIGDFYSSEVPGGGWSESGTYSSNGEVSAAYSNEAENGTLVITAAASDTYEGYTEVNIGLSVSQ